MMGAGFPYSPHLVIISPLSYGDIDTKQGLRILGSWHSCANRHQSSLNLVASAQRVTPRAQPLQLGSFYSFWHKSGNQLGLSRVVSAFLTGWTSGAGNANPHWHSMEFWSSNGCFTYCLSKQLSCTLVPKSPNASPGASPGELATHQTYAIPGRWPFFSTTAWIQRGNLWESNQQPTNMGLYWTISGWWYTHPSEKYEFVSWDDEIPNIWKI